LMEAVARFLLGGAGFCLLFHSVPCVIRPNLAFGVQLSHPRYQRIRLKAPSQAISARVHGVDAHSAIRVSVLRRLGEHLPQDLLRRRSWRAPAPPSPKATARSSRRSAWA
jgi:hypothetical protein